MLFGENESWGDERHLLMTERGIISDQSCHHGFPGTDIALHKA